MAIPSFAHRAFWAGMLAIVSVLLAIAAVGPAANNAGAAAPTENSARSFASEKLAPDLLNEFNTSRTGKVRYLVVLREQADTSNSIRDWNARGWYVYNKLREVANRTQPPVAEFIKGQQQRGNVDSYKSYYIINAFQVVGNLTSAEAVASLSEVARVDVFPRVELDPVQPVTDPNAVEWNVNHIRAPAAWQIMCPDGNPCQGYGSVAGSLDTGARHTHQALVRQYRGTISPGNYDHNYNWWPAVGSSPVPVDDPGASYHGTHTIGTIVGEDESQTNQIGVAPRGKWIATNGIASGATDADVIEAGQWILAPWDLNGQNPDPARRPDVASNSWGYGASNYACSGMTFFRDVVINWRNAGIFPSFSAGNAGTTGNRIPSAYPETFETGSITQGWTISSFSSRGPSCFDGGQHPQVVTGGSSVRSASGASDTGYSVLSGTSMAQPATAGSVLILKQANRNLTIQETWYILTSTAVMSPGWGTRPNMTYGWGVVQLDAAVQMAISMGGTPTPTVTNTPMPTNTATNTATSVPTNTATNTATNTRTNTPVPTNTVVPSPTPCNITFTDVPSDSPFRAGIICLACRGVVSGYEDGTFKPNNWVTRGQLAKIVSEAARFSEDPHPQIYEDVPSVNPFYVWINRLSRRGHMGGYDCGGPGEPCEPPFNRPYFRPYANATRGQTSKIVSNAAGLTDPVSGQTFEDVPTNHPFYEWIERLADRGVMGGYECGTAGEPCIPPNNRPYFRPYNAVTRGQSAKIVANTFYPECNAVR